jgi:hypothetical protein
MTAIAPLTRLLAALVLLTLAGCSSEPEPLPSACLGEPAAVLTALERAPGAVVLDDGTRLSRCVSAARTDGELQSLGLSLMRVADTLRARAPSDAGAALRLGYLAGAVRAGAAANTAVAGQLARRVEQLAVLQEDAGRVAAAALRRGVRAGERSG